MAGESPRYLSWLRTQPCARCGVGYGIEAHHPLWATTYSPEETRPAKAIEGARKGKGQKCHDHFALPLCLKCHIPGIHRGGGHFHGTTVEEREAWEREQIPLHRQRYAMQSPGPAPLASPMRSPKPRASSGDAAHRERLRVADFLRREAASTHRTPDAAAALNDCADVLSEEAF